MQAADAGGDDFSRNVSASTPGAFILASDFYTNPATPRVPWANEPMCQSCHTGDVLNNLTNSPGVIKAADGVRLLQAHRTTDANAKPLVATNRRFAENASGAKQVLSNSWSVPSVTVPHRSPSVPSR